MDAAAQITTKKFQGFTGTSLKLIACLSMLIDHIGASCLEQGVLARDDAGVSAAFLANIGTLDTVLRFIGRLAFPIYCFLLVEGFLHTHNVKKYLFRLALFAAISEVVFDWAFFRSPMQPAHQNVYLTLFIGMLCLIWLKRFDKPDIPSHLLRAAGILICGAAAELLHTDYGFIGVGLIAVLYLLRSKPVWRTVCGCLIVSYELTAPLAFIPIHFYNGQRGKCPQALQYAFYAFYPVHLAILALITNLLLYP